MINSSRNQDRKSMPHVCIGVPVTQGRGGRTQLASSPALIHFQEKEDISNCRLCVLWVGALAVPVTILVLLLFAIGKLHHPTFKIESVTVSLPDAADLNFTSIESKWDLGFSVTNSERYAVIFYKDIDVYVMDKAGHSSGTVIPSFQQGKRDTTLLNVTLEAVLPGFYVGGSVIQLYDFQVKMNVVYDYRGWYPSEIGSVRVLCKDLTVRFPSVNASKGSMVDGPKSCLHTY